jgi:hypothetical protein
MHLKIVFFLQSKALKIVQLGHKLVNKLGLHNTHIDLETVTKFLIERSNRLSIGWAKLLIV